MLFLAVPAHADWYVGYALELDNDDADDLPSRLSTATPVGIGFDLVRDTSLTPVWSDGETVPGTSELATSAELNGVSVPPGDVQYGDPPGSGAPVPTQNLVIVHFFEDTGEGNGLAGIQDGRIEAIRLDYYSYVTSSTNDTAEPPNEQFLWGENDTTQTGAMSGTVVGGVVDAWLGQLRGLVHNEIFCIDLPSFTVCNPAFGLPPDHGIDISHFSIGNQIAVAGDPDNPQAESMTFFDDYKQVNFEVTLLDGANATSRIYYEMDGKIVFKYYGDKAIIPTLSHWQLGLLAMGLVGIAIPVLLRVRPREV